MLGVRLGLVAVYSMLGGLVGRYLHNRRPTPNSNPLLIGARPFVLLLWLWGPLLWVFPGLFWIGLLEELTIGHLILLSVFVPLSVCLILLLIVGAFSPGGEIGKVLLPFTLSAAMIVVLVTLVALWWAEPVWREAPVRFGLFIITMTLPPIVLLLLLAGWAVEVLPLPLQTPRRTRRALSLILGFLATSPKTHWVVEDGKVETRIKGSAGMGLGRGLLITEPENVVVLKRGPSISRVAGPGAVLTEPWESPLKVVDLRNQFRSTRVNAITRDGIEVSVPISTLFRIRRGPEKVPRLGSWPYRTQRDVLEAVLGEEVDPSGRSPLDAPSARPWEDLPIKVATHAVERAISFYTLDQIYQGPWDPQTSQVEATRAAELGAIHREVASALELSQEVALDDPLTRVTIGRMVRRKVHRALARSGYEILGGGVGNVIEPLNPGVTEQRVDVWKSRLDLQVQAWRADLELQRALDLDKVEQATRERLLETWIEAVCGELETADDVTRRNFVAYQMLGSLLSIARKPDVQRMLPRSAVPTLQRLLDQMRGSQSRELGR